MSNEKSIKDSKIFNFYRWSVIILGIAVIVFSFYRFDILAADYSYFLFSIFTLVFASRIVVKIPRVKGFVSVSDTFIFLSILLFGGEAGIMLATADAIIPSYKLAKTRITFLFNVAVFALATFATVWILRLIFGSLRNLSEKEFSSEYVVAICLMAFIQYAVNSGLGRDRRRTPGKNNRSGRCGGKIFFGLLMTYFAGASAAGIIAKMIGFSESMLFWRPLRSLPLFTLPTRPI